MTNEQAIETVKKTTKMDFNNPNGWTGYYDTELKELQQAIETVLNMLNEKDKEIEHWKNGFERELEDNRKNTCELLKQDLIIREKDKQIDLMSKEIKERNYNFTNKNIKEIKQYFENKVNSRKEKECLK